MATVKIKFRPSTVDGEQGVISYQVIHNRLVRQHKSTHRLYVDEWDNDSSQVVFPVPENYRSQRLFEISERIKIDVRHLQRIIESLNNLGCDYSADDVFAKFYDCSYSHDFFLFAEDAILNLKSLGRIRTAETYKAALSSFCNFRRCIDIAIEDIDADVIMRYEAWLKGRGICPNTSSFYMRNLRALYNKAVAENLTAQCHPFRHVYTGIDKTVKRAISLCEIKLIKNLDLTAYPLLNFARDLFMFSFFTRGMSFVDMAYLRKKDLSNGILVYRRRKTEQLLSVKWEKCMQDVVDKYSNPRSRYLLPIINPASLKDERRQYINASHNVNRRLKIIGQMLSLPVSLTMYVSRHAWASIARNRNVPLSVISQAMGHDSELTTRIYLASLDNTAIDNANRMILNSL